MPGMIQPSRRVILDPETNLIYGVLVQPFGSAEWKTLMFDVPFHALAWDAWQAGEYIQRALTTLTADEREFLLTGMTPAEWDAAFPEEDE